MLKEIYKMFTKEGEKGASAVEYALIAGLIAVVIIVTVQTLGTRITATFQSIVTALGG